MKTPERVDCSLGAGRRRRRWRPLFSTPAPFLASTTPFQLTQMQSRMGPLLAVFGWWRQVWAVWARFPTAYVPDTGVQIAGLYAIDRHAMGFTRELRVFYPG